MCDIPVLDFFKKRLGLEQKLQFKLNKFGVLLLIKVVISIICILIIKFGEQWGCACWILLELLFFICI